MRGLLFFWLVLMLAAAGLAETPFPNKGKNEWVYKTMWAIKRDHMWYRVKDNVEKRRIPTRNDLAVKTIFLALDSHGLLQSFEGLVAMSRAKASDAQSRKWASQFRASFPKKKALYRTHFQRVSKLWAFFRPEIRKEGKRMKLDVGALGKRLQMEQRRLESIKA